MNFDFQPELISESVALRPLRQSDFDELFAVASDPAIWAGHPIKNRFERAVFEPYFVFLVASQTALVIYDTVSGAAIGCSRYYVGPDAPDGIAIGFTFLAKARWGGETNFQVKQLMHSHAFKTFDAVWYHIDPTNIRSQKATARLGAKHIGDAVIDLAGSPAPWMRFRLDHSDWKIVAEQRLGR